MNRPIRPAISVALSVYNGARFLSAAIDSVLAQSFADFEFLLLDDGSTDSSADIIRQYAARDARIRPILRENRGLVTSLNQLLAEARAPLIARMDADDICLPQRFAAQVAFLDQHPDYGVVGTATEDIDDNDAPWPCHAPPYVASHAEILGRIATGGPLLCHPSVMFRADVVRGVGGYHAAFRHCEDLDLWLRLASVTRLGNLPERLLRYRHYADQVSSRHSTEQQIGAAIARTAYAIRAAGLPDPTEHLDRLPPLDEIDALFARPGLAREIRAAVTPGIIYSPHSLRDAGIDLILRHITEGGDRAGLWRTVARLCRLGEPTRAMHLAATLART